MRKNKLEDKTGQDLTPRLEEPIAIEAIGPFPEREGEAKMVAMKDGTLVPEGIPIKGRNYSEYTLEDNVERRVWEFTDRFQRAPEKIFVFKGHLCIGPQPKQME